MGDTCGQIWGTKSATVRQQMHPKPVQGTENGNRSAENASKMHTVCTKMHPEPVRGHQKCQPFVKKCVKNADRSLKNRPSGSLAPSPREHLRCTNRNRSHENASKMRTVRPEFDVEHAKMATVRQKMHKNAHRRAEIGCLDLTQPGQGLEFWGAILNPLSLLLLDFALPVANKLVLTFDRVRLFPCTCQAPCFLRARRAHCAYRRA